MITKSDYFIGRAHTNEHDKQAEMLLFSVNNLLADAAKNGVRLFLNPATGTFISGKTEGGFRLPDCCQGAQNSSHKEAKGVDVFDPNNELDDWLTRNPSKLVEFNLYREHQSATEKWCHLTTRAPKSGRRTFLP